MKNIITKAILILSWLWIWFIVFGLSVHIKSKFEEQYLNFFIQVLHMENIVFISNLYGLMYAGIMLFFSFLLIYGIYTIKIGWDRFYSKMKSDKTIIFYLKSAYLVLWIAMYIITVIIGIFYIF